MMQIRPEQVAAFQSVSIERFETTMLRHVLSNYPEESQTLGGSDAVLALIRRTVQRGKSIGFVSERDLAALINLTVVYGERFEYTMGDGDIRDVLHDADILPATRIELVLDMLPDD